MEFMDELACANSYNLTTDISWSKSGTSSAEKPVCEPDRNEMNPIEPIAENDVVVTLEEECSVVVVDEPSPALPCVNASEGGLPELSSALDVVPTRSTPLAPQSQVNGAAALPLQRIKRSISSSESSDSAKVESVRCGLAKKLFDAQKSLAKLPAKTRKKRQVKPQSSKSSGLKQRKLSGFFKAELGPAKPLMYGSSEYEADGSSCNSDS